MSRGIPILTGLGGVGLLVLMVVLLRPDRPEKGRPGGEEVVPVETTGGVETPSERVDPPVDLPSADHPGTIEGRVVDEMGKGAAEVRVVPTTFDSRLRQGKTILTGVDGGFLLEGLPKGTYALRATSPKGATALRTGVHLPEGANVRLSGPLVLMEGFFLEVHAVDEAGEPVPFAGVVLRQEISHEGRVRYPVEVARASASKNGKIVFEGLSGGGYQVQGLAEGHAGRSVMIQVSEMTKPVTLVLRAGKGATKR